MFAHPLLVLLLILISSPSHAEHSVDPKADVASLIHAHAVWRHGDRSPTVLIPTDTANNITTWEMGLGELTKEGEAQQFRLGQYLRRRYDQFLSATYSPFEIYVRSSDYNRTLSSAQANMAGLYPPSEKELFVPDLHWRPIPVHTIPKVLDKELFDKAFCPAATAEGNRVFGSTEVKKIEKDNEHFLRFVGEKAGLKVPLPLRAMWDVFDPLNSEFFHRQEHPFPQWVNATIWEHLTQLYDLSNNYQYHSELQTRLRAGPLFADILNRMKAVAAHRQDAREKMYFYSAHDTSVAAILAAMGIRPPKFPLYASLVLIELHKTTTDPEVRLFYKNETDGATLWEWDISDCPKPCTLPKLEAAKLGITPLNWEEECGLYNSVLMERRWYHFSTRGYLLIIGVLSSCCVGLLIEVGRKQEFPSDSSPILC